VTRAIRLMARNVRGFADVPLHHVSPHAPMRVLVADDDEDMLLLMAETLRADGYDVLTARDGEELLVSLERAIDGGLAGVDLVITDVMMPGLSGLGALEALRRAQVRLPVIVMTVLADDSIWTVAKRLGAVGVLRKPFDVDDMRTAVVNAVLVYEAAERR
jgi:CheY-like chemotaxis protein